MEEELKVQWYAVSTSPGRERKVKESLEARARSYDMEQYFHRAVLVEQPEIEVKHNKTVEVMKNVYSGYIFVQVEMTDDLWYMIRNTPGVTGFIGSSGKGAKPIPVKESDMLNVLALAGENDANIQKQNYKAGDMVRILTGPFAQTEGKILSINENKQTAKVEVILFGRLNSMDIEFNNLNPVKD